MIVAALPRSSSDVVGCGRLSLWRYCCYGLVTLDGKWRCCSERESKRVPLGLGMWRKTLLLLGVGRVGGCVGLWCARRGLRCCEGCGWHSFCWFGWGGGLDCSSPRWPSMLTLCFLFCCFWFLSPPAFLGIWMMMAALPRSCGCALVISGSKCRCCRDPLAVAAASERARERPWGGGCGGCLFCCLVVGVRWRLGRSLGCS